MARNPKITFIGAGSTVFMKNIVGDVLQRPSLSGATIALMDINPQRLEESALVVNKLIATLSVKAKAETYSDQRKALAGADFVVVAFQIGGYEPCTVTDFEVPKKYGLRQTIADTLGVGGIMRGLRTVPHLWNICEDMLAVCPEAIMLQYVNPMAINTWAISEKYPAIRQVGLCHSVQGTAMELAHDLDLPYEEIRYRSAGINHMAFYLKFEHRQADGSYRDLYPDLVRAYREGRAPKPGWNPRCPNKVRYEMLTRLGFFVTESSEHFAEYTPYFIKDGRPDLIEKFGIPLDEYPKRCIEQIERWKGQAEAYRSADRIEVEQSKEYASSIMNSVWTGEPSVIYGNVRNNGCITSLPFDCAAEVPCLVDASGIQPTYIGDLPPQLTALIRTNINVQELTVRALMSENREHIYHAAMMDPHTAAELDLDQIWSLVDDLLAAHGDWLPAWARKGGRSKAA
ncbi:MAG: alpha-glucosidase/alpha-galactosidase [Mesorhizobium sp.]|uniref:alpha-glucosidase/alpha-galactosidase n=1 Tax=unclassified Mesorhizobium TaxID=325217 RepID=UPI000FCC0A59|nr:MULTISPECIES: alpha-glucosidase/alpha-galactosidase [unclassified Mesorhizobium]RUX46760.1 alpha-glucosidase/alpha-galactosidase [Mesorhizobium sp. M4A.F.Ca.ET.050.02.1.1]RVD36655.1 alpha-glucosidase/alpha-galactosidase [Mesorhizobium sp. M4A.F.Ca.ET.020.02.1.1]RWC08003.1 MAG: alpha-glucosidase/alpha-galactosidase [Mesorhizobium sp.]RWD03997.1 MAG: alpha-glucosidase/alpha-galactosidase [Mesorhizobium sp.]RWD26666.1 MAG: alpha-glucosidase/alpha-galactosidase [Mesorhizobium sp.]